MNYNPKDASQCWPEGDYHGTLVKVEESQSKRSGNDMEAWTFRAYHQDGREQIITDYVVVPSCVFKIKQLAIALGRKDDFENGVFQAADYLKSDVLLALKIEESDEFDDKNKIAKVKAAASTAPAPRPAAQAPRQSATPQRQSLVARPMANVGLAGIQRPPAQPAATQPYDDGDQQFKEDDIPF
jgi:hypothetical protein